MRYISHNSDNLHLIILSKFIKGTNCFKFLKKRLPAHTIKRLDELVNLKCKIVSERVKLNFYKCCLSSHVFPNQLYKNLRSSNLQPNISNLVRLSKLYIDNYQDKLINLIELHIQALPILTEISIVCHIK